MDIKNYRSFIREQRREVNKSTLSYDFDYMFENKVNDFLREEITISEFEYYLENELYLNINENYLITENLATTFANKVISKIKSVFNNLYKKLKESNGFKMIISFFDKVVSGLSKFFKFLKKIKAGKILKKLMITLGITSVASYILAQFGAGWVALMSGRMASQLFGKKVADKVVKENFKHLMLFEQFDGLKNLNTFLSKIGVSTNKLKSSTIIDFYKKVFSDNYSHKFDKFSSSLEQNLKLLKNAANSRNENRIKEALSKIKSILSINEDGLSDMVSNKKIESYLSKSDGRKWGNLHDDLLKILSSYGLVKSNKDVDDKNTVIKGKETVSIDKSDKSKDKTVSKDKSDVDSIDSGVVDDSEVVDGDKEKKKKSIWAKIGSSISKFFKILRKLKWAIVIFFGVVFILNLIFAPIFEPVLQVAQVSSFSMILSDGFEETANAVSSIPKIDTDDINLNLDITGDLPDDSEVTKTIQGAINDIKDNIEGNEELAAEEADDVVQKAFNETRTGSINLSEMDDELFNKLPNTFVAAESPNLRFVHNLADNNARNVIGKALADDGNYNVSMSGSVNDLYEFKTFEYEQDGKTVYKIIGIKRDSIGEEVSGEKWNELLDKKDIEPSQEVEQKGKFWKDLKDKTKDVLNITDGDKYTKGLEKEGWEFALSKQQVIKDINDNDVEFELSEIKFSGDSQSATKNAFLSKLSKSDEYKDLPENMRSNIDKYLVYKDEGGEYTYKVLIPKSDVDVSGLSGDELVEQLGSQIKEIGKSISESGYDNFPGNDPIELSIANSLKTGQLSSEDLEKLKNINTDDFHSSVSKIKQNGYAALQNKLTEQGIKPNSQYMFFKELDNGNTQWFYLIPKK